MKGGTKSSVSRDRRRDANDLLKIAVENYEDILIDLHDMKTAIRSSGKFSETEARRIVSMVSKTIQTIYDERKRLNDLNEREKGRGKDSGVDFDEVRAEIRRRLDRIRAARSGREIPRLAQ